MTSVMKGGFGPPAGSSSSAAGNNSNTGTEFLSMVAPLKDKLNGYDNTLPCSEQSITIPQAFRDAMLVREQVFGEQGVSLEAEFDEDDPRSWHWVVYASTAVSSRRPTKELESRSPGNPAEEARRSSATAMPEPVGTIRLIPPPHGPNKFVEDSGSLAKSDSKHSDAGPTAPSSQPTEPYVKLGRLAILAPYRKLGLASMLINAATDFAKNNADAIFKPPSATTLELATQQGQDSSSALVFNGLFMIHAQAAIQKMWESRGFSEELRGADGEVEIKAEPRWMEEGIEHVGMWKRVEVKRVRLA